MKTNHLTLKIIALIILNDLCDTLSQLLMKKGLTQTGITSVHFANFIDFTLKSASSFYLWIGIIIYMLNFFIWIAILYKVDLSIAMPVGSTSYLLVPIMAVFFLHEHVSFLRWIGAAFIILGIHFVSQSKKTIKEGS